MRTFQKKGLFLLKKNFERGDCMYKNQPKLIFHFLSSYLAALSVPSVI